MPFGGLLTASLIGAGSSIVGGVLGRKKKQTSTTTPILSPEQERLRGSLGEQLLSRLQNPQAPGEVGAIRNRARGKINQTFDSLGSRIEAQNARRGFGRTGATGSQLTTLQVGRANQFGDLEAQLEEYLNNLKVQERDRTSRDALDFIRMGAGQQTTGTANDPGAPFRGIGEGLTDISFMLALNKLMGKGGGPAMPG